MFKKSLSILLILSIIMVCPLTAFAMTATPSDAMGVPVATSSNTIPFQDYMESDDFDTLDVPSFMSSGDSPVFNTVDYSGVYLAFAYYDMSGRTKVVQVQVDDDGYASIGLPSDCARPFWLGYIIYNRSLPSAGKYRMNIHFGSNTGIVYSGSDVSFFRKSSNVAEQFSLTSVTGTYSSGDFNLQVDLSLSSTVSYMHVMNYIKGNDQYPPFGGYVDISFTRLSSGAATNLDSPGVDSIDRDIQQDISNNTAHQVEQGDTIIELIKNTIQTISSQLTAFWNQLAGEFTNLYNKMTQQHSEQLQADRDNTDDIIAAEESNTTNIINNNNANTDKLAKGYDSSKLNESGNSLNNKLQEYESAESGINDTASGWLNDFTMPDFDNLVNTGGILSACIWLGSFWQTIFTDMGSFNIPVTLSFTLIFVLMLIGYHRFRR